MSPSFFAVGICVSDMDRATLFYTQVLDAVVDFTVDLPAELPGNHRALIEVADDINTRTRFLKVGGSTIELLAFTKSDGGPGTTGTGERRPMNLTGLTHLSYKAVSREHAQEIIGKVEQFGGKVVRGAHLSFAHDGAEVEIQFVLDPDGTRIEVVFDNGLGLRKTTS